MFESPIPMCSSVIAPKSSATTGGKRNLKFIVGPKYRTTTGCITCRKKKRKCDETSPVCLFCKARGFDCVYQQTKKPKNKTSRDLVHVSQNKPTSNSLDFSVAESIINEATFNTPDLNFFTNSNGLEIKSDQLQLDTTYAPVPTLTSNLSSLPWLCLDYKGVYYLDYFQTKLSGILAISFDSMNYFKKLFYQLAHHEETFTYIVAAWGALYCKDRVYDDEVRFYLNKGLKKFNALFGNKINGFDYYFQMCFYLIVSEMNICIGELHEWRVYFDKTCELILEYGGLEKLCQDFGYSHEIRFMISNLQYNDIMSSSTVAKGTSLPVSEYQKVFSHPNFKRGELSYGIDTLQGCHQLVLLLLGDVLNHKVTLSRNLIQLESISTMTEEGMKEYQRAKKLYYKSIEAIASTLDNEINHVEPNRELLESIKSNRSEYDVYYKTYELYKKCCRIYWYLYIKQIVPSNYQVQEVVLECFELIDFLIPSKMNIILCYPLLICGLCVFEDADKQYLESRVKKVEILSPVNNLDKCWTIIQKVWQLNERGNVIVDWSCICDELQWELNVC